MNRRRFLFYLGGFLVLPISSHVLARRINLRGLGAGIRHGDSASNDNLLSKEELRNCFDIEAEYENMLADLKEKEVIIDSELNEIGKEKKIIKQAEDRLDVYSQKSVNDFNNLVEKSSERISYYNEVLLKEYNELSIKIKSAQNNFNFYCGDKQYLVEDYEALRTELGY